MADLLILEDADYSEMTGAWAKGGKYRVELTITQTSDPGQPFTATVDEVTDYGDVDTEEVAKEVKPPAKPAKPSAKEPKEATY